MSLKKLLTDFNSFYEDYPLQKEYRTAAGPAYVAKTQDPQKQRNLPYGDDQPGGGDSKQPFITKNIPGVEKDPDSVFPDFLLRDPKNALDNRVDDFKRIGKFLTTTEGILFVTKQELLSLQNPLVPGRPNRATPISGLYNPLMTLAQVTGAGTGLHIEKQGLFPIFNNNDKYDHVYRNRFSEENNNRLTLLYTSKISSEGLSGAQTINALRQGITSDNNLLLSYMGGPDSLGLGRTRIPFAGDRLSPSLLNDRTNEAKTESYNKTHDLSTNYNSVLTNFPLNTVSVSGLVKQYIDPKFDPYFWVSSNGKANSNYQYRTQYINEETENPSLTTDLQSINSAKQIANNQTVSGSIYSNQNITSSFGLSNKYNEEFKFIDKYKTDQFLNNNNQLFNASLRNDSNVATLRNEIKAGTEVSASLSSVKNHVVSGSIDSNKNISKFLGTSNKSTVLKYITITTGNDGINNISQLTQNSVYTLGNTFPEINTNNTTKLNVFTYTQNQLKDSELFRTNSQLQDFRSTILKDPINASSTQLYSFNYTSPNVNLESRIGVGNPGNRNRGRDRDALANLANPDEAQNNSNVIDKINYQKLYRASDGPSPYVNAPNASLDKSGRDLITFYFSIIDNDDVNSASFIHFRAYLGSVRDSYGAEYKSTKYVGRGEKFYSYDGFSRTISLSFRVVPQTAWEMKGIHQKLNYLASTLAPDYGDITNSNESFMRSNIVKLWMGEYFYGIPGFITDLTYTIPEESSWEINFNQPENGPGGGGGNLLTGPMLWDVDMTFVPIHNFVPRIITTEGKQREVAFITPDSTYGQPNPYLNEPIPPKS